MTDLVYSDVQVPILKIVSLYIQDAR